MKINEISLNPSAIIRALGSVALLLVLASLSGQLSKFMFGHGYLKGFVPLFDVNGERNIPTFFSLFLMINVASLLAIISILNSNRKIPHVSKWITLSIGFIFMAYDEAFIVHEMLHRPFRNLLGDSNLGIFYFTWVVPAIVIVFALMFYFLKFLLHLPAKHRFTFLLAGSIYLGGCIGFELIGGKYAELYGIDNLTCNVISTVEESLEMAGLIVFIWALLVYISDNYEEVRFRFKKECTGNS